VTDADEREQLAGGGRITLNLGHSLGHAVEAAAGFGDLLHGEAVAHGLRAAVRIGTALGETPRDRADRIERLLTTLELATEPLPYPLESVLDALGADKKHADGSLRWVVPTGDSVTVRDDVPDELVRAAASSLLATGAAARR
jgi:3-dehydroquinate synthase